MFSVGVSGHTLLIHWSGLQLAQPRCTATLPRMVSSGFSSEMLQNSSQSLEWIKSDAAHGETIFSTSESLLARRSLDLLEQLGVRKVSKLDPEGQRTTEISMHQLPEEERDCASIIFRE